MTNDLAKITPLSVKDLTFLGLQEVAYIRRVDLEEGPRYMIHAADGTPVGMAEDRDGAFATVLQHGLEPVSVH